MKPGQLTPNELEVAILKEMAREKPLVQSIIDKLHVLSREFTGAGSYTNFSPLAEAIPSIGNMPISLNSIISIPGVEHGLGATLFFENGHPKFLELCTFGNTLWDGNYEGFSFEQNA